MAEDKKTNRRDFIFTASYALGAVGVGAAVWPLIDQMNPDASVKALASTEVDISGVERGQSITVLWRGKPVFIRRRTDEEIAKAKEVDLKELKRKFKEEKVKLKNFGNTSNTLINIGAKIGRLMETTQKAIEDDSEMGDKLSQKEKELIHKSIDEVEEKILQLKVIVDKN